MFVPRIALDGSLQRPSAASANDDSNTPGNFSPRPSAERHRPAASESHVDPVASGRPHGGGGGSQRRSPSQPMNSLVETAEYWEHRRDEEQHSSRSSSAATGGSSAADAPMSTQHRLPAAGYDVRARGGAAAAAASRKVQAPISRLRILQQIRQDSDALPSGPLTDAEGRPVAAPVRPRHAENPARSVTAVAQCETSGLLAYGDRSGRIYLFRQPATGDDGADDDYAFHIGKQCYTSVIDPLNSVEVTPGLTSLAFLPQVNPRHFLLVANEKVPKLYKVMSVSEAAQQFRAVDLIGTKMIGPLTLPNRPKTVAMKQVARYAQDHEYTIHSLVPLAMEPRQFATADEASVKLWCVEHPNDSVEVLSVKRKDASAQEEVLRAAYNFPHAPALFFATTSAGAVRVVDMRESLRWHDREAHVFTNPQRAEDGQYSAITAALSGCDLSPCGRYVAARDFFGATLWDVRLCGAPAASIAGSSSARGDGAAALLCRAAVQSDLREHLDGLYNADLLADKFDIRFVDSCSVLTGGYRSQCNLFDIHKQQSTGPSSAAAAAAVTKFTIPTHEETSRRWGNPAAYVERLQAPAGAEGGSDVGQRVKFILGMRRGADDACEMVVSAGDTLTRLRLCR